MASITHRFLVPVSTVSARKAWHNDPPFVYKIRWKTRGYFQKIGWGCAARFLKPLPYFRPKSVIFPTLFQTWSKIWLERVTSCYGTYTAVGVNIKREMVLSPNKEEVTNSSKKLTQFKTRVHKPYPISDQMVEIDTLFQTKTTNKKNIHFGAAHIFIAYIRKNPLPLPQRKTRCRLWVSLLTQARLIIVTFRTCSVVTSDDYFFSIYFGCCHLFMSSSVQN